jgi:TM2 domain-containing membrane protein YozV
MTAGAETCPKCGAMVAPSQQQSSGKQTKSVAAAAVASAIFPGLGQIYNGEPRKGVLFIIIGALCLSPLLGMGTIRNFALVLYPLFWIYGVYNAYTTAKDINEGGDDF